VPGEVLVIAVFLADYNVVGEVYLDGALGEVRLLTASCACYFFAPAAAAFGQFLGRTPLGSLSSAYKILLIGLLIDSGEVAAAGLTALSLLAIDPLLQVSPFLLHLPECLHHPTATSNSCAYLAS
jgi:hypothetical protein